LLALHVYWRSQKPFLQRVEQQSAPLKQACPMTLHAAVDPGMGWQVPPEQLPVQQLLLAEQVPPVSRHRSLEQMLLSQRLRQQSLLLAHGLPAVVHATAVFAQTWSTLQTPWQQTFPPAHESPSGAHELTGGPPSPPPSGSP
jgi:hypothetical protein